LSGFKVRPSICPFSLYLMNILNKNPQYYKTRDISYFVEGKCHCIQFPCYLCKAALKQKSAIEMKVTWLCSQNV